MVRWILRTAILAALLLGVTAPAAFAQGNGPGFHVSAGGNLDCPGGQTLSQLAPPAVLGPITIPCTSGQGIAAAEAGAGTMRALGRSEHICCGTASGGSGSARILIENVVITGPPAASIPISLNFQLRGTLTANTDHGPVGVSLFLALRGFNTNLASLSRIEMSATEVVNKTGVFAPFDVPFPIAGIDQALTTETVNAAPNWPLTLEFQLLAMSSMAGAGAAESDFFSGTNGFSLPFGIPVFNLPPGYTINIPALNVIDNHVALPAFLDGDIYIVGTNASEISVAGVNQVLGNVTIASNPAASVIDLSTLEAISGYTSISDNASASSIDLGSVVTVGSSLSIDGNGSTLTIDLGSLATTGGSVSIDNNASTTTVDLASLATSGGSISISGNSSVTNVVVPALDIVGGNLNISDNTSVTGIDLAALDTVDGDLSVTDNGACTTLVLGSLTTVGGNLTLESCGTGTFSPGPAAAGGNTTLTTAGYTTVSGTTATGTTTVSNATAEALMTVQLPAGSFTTPVSFSLTHMDPATLAPEPGLDATNSPATIDPVAAYQITFGVPTLNRDATLTFDVFVAGLADATAFLDALAGGLVTLATRSDVPGNQYQAFPICTGGAQPTPGGCVVVALLDANGQPTTGTPAIVRFSNVVGHFSTWAVAIVTPQSAPTHFFNGLLAPYPAPPHTTTPTFKRGSVVPLKFAWADATGALVDSAAANPTVTIYSAACTTQAPATDPIAPDDAGESGGLRYDAGTQTWTFNWSTKPLPASCFGIQVTTGTPAYAAPAVMFPVALRDK